MSNRRTAILTLPGAGSAVLRNINKIWNLHDASYAVLHDLHPHGEHRANEWSSMFQLRLERIVKLTSLEEKEEVMQQMRDVVYFRHQGKESRLLCVTVSDLETLYRRIMRKKTRERNAAARLVTRQRSARQEAMDAGWLRSALQDLA
jgi:hypothetical protein